MLSRAASDSRWISATSAKRLSFGYKQNGGCDPHLLLSEPRSLQLLFVPKDELGFERETEILIFKALRKYNLIYMFIIIIIIIIIIGIQPLGRSGQRPEFRQATGTLHLGHVLRGSLSLLSPAFF